MKKPKRRGRRSQPLDVDHFIHVKQAGGFSCATLDLFGQIRRFFAETPELALERARSLARALLKQKAHARRPQDSQSEQSNQPITVATYIDLQDQFQNSLRVAV